MKSATELLGEMLRIYDEPDKGAGDLHSWVHQSVEEIRKCEEGGERPVEGWVLDNGVLRNEELDSSIALFNDAAYLLLNAQRENATLRGELGLLEEQTEHYSLVDQWAWEKVVRIGKRILDIAYPEDMFDGSSGDPGPLYVVALRDALVAIDRARGEGE